MSKPEQQQQTEQQQPEGNVNEDLSAMFRGFSDALMEQVEAKLKAVATPPTQSDATETSPSATLTQRIAQLEKQLAEKAEAEAKTARQQSYDNAVKSELSRFQLAFPNETTDIIKGLVAASVEQVEGKWLTKDGKSLQEHLDGFFGTPFGQHLLKAPTGQAGSGTVPSQNPRQQPTPDTRTALGKLFGLS